MSLTNKLLPLSVAVWNSLIALDAVSAEGKDKNAVPEEKKKLWLLRQK